MQFFKDITKKLNVFLTRFHTNNPMLPFLSDAVAEVFTSPMSNVIKRNVLNDAITALKLVIIDMTDRKMNLTLCPSNLVQH